LVKNHAVTPAEASQKSSKKIPVLLKGGLMANRHFSPDVALAT
jgi:hypothetical protein